MRRVSLSIALLVAVVLVALGLGAPSAQPAPQKVVFALNWFPVGDHAAYWVALEKGYYRQRGLDVDMQNSKGSGDSIANVDTGRAHRGLPFYEKAVGKGNAVMLPWADHGFDMFSMSIIAGEKTMKERAPMLRAFLEASYLGWRDVMSDPKSALEIFKKRVPEIDLSIIEPNMMMGLELMKTDRYARNGIGWMEEKKMCDSVDLVNTYIGVPTKVECKAVSTNEFPTPLYPPNSPRSPRAAPTPSSSP